MSFLFFFFIFGLHTRRELEHARIPLPSRGSCSPRAADGAPNPMSPPTRGMADRASMSEQEYDSYVEFLLDAFDRPCIIFNVRSRRDVARSSWWLSDPFADSHLRLCERRFDRSIQLHPECTFRLEYDRYVQNPDELRSLFSFLDAKFDRDALAQVLATTHSTRSAEDRLERLHSARSIVVSMLAIADAPR